MKKWKKSIYTYVIETRQGIILYNSFMGAIARIPEEHVENVKNILAQEIEEKDIEDPLVYELSMQGFIIPDEIEEQNAVITTLEKEQESTLGLTIMPHEDCNFRCSYCYESFENGIIRPKIIRGIKAFVKKKAESGKFSRLTCAWFGGEPLLAFDKILELSDSFLEYCSENKVKYTSSMTTNGYLLTPQRVEKLIERNILYYQITLDGPESFHNRSRKLIGGQGTYSTIIENLKSLKKLDNEELTVKIRVNFSPKSLEVIEEWIEDEIAPIFSEDKRFMLMFHPVRNWGGCNNGDVEYFDEKFSTAEHIASLNRACLDMGFSKEEVRRSLDPHGNVCYASKRNSLVIGSDGMLYKCTVAFDSPINHIGVINEDGTLNINHLKMSRWTKDYIDSVEKCKSCTFYPSCQTKKCPLSAINCGEPSCPVVFEDIENYLKSTIG